MGVYRKLRALIWAAGCCALAVSGCANFELPRIDPSGEHIFLPPGSPASPVVTGPPPITAAPLAAPPPGAPPVAPPSMGAAGAPPMLPPAGFPQPGVIVAPSHMVAPINSEVVMTASVLAPDGVLEANQRIEWTLAPDGPGQFVELGERSPFDVLSCFQGLPKKVDSRFAVNTTAWRQERLTRGTPTPVDDIFIDRGQAWVTVTSSVEGTSHLTAYAPVVDVWDRRQQSATIHWIDAQWRFPPPAINPVGTRHTFTTILSRQSDGSPIAGWRVRYEIAGGPDAGFAPDGARATEVVANELGQASAEIFQKQPTPGTNQIVIRVIRPPSAASGDGQAFVVATGGTLKSWTSAGLALKVNGPAQAGVGTTATYRIDVTNPSGAPAREIVVTDQPSPGLSYLNSDPPATSSPSGQEWRIGELGPGQTRSIEVNYRAGRAGPLTYCASASAAGGLAARDCATTSIGAAQLSVNVLGPTAAQVGTSATFEITIVNASNAPATGLVISDRFDAGLQHASESSPIEHELPDLPPGGSRKVNLTLRVADQGSLCQTIEIRGREGVVASTRHCLNATSPAVQPTPPVIPPVSPPTQPPALPPAQPTIPPMQPSTEQPGLKLDKSGPRQRKVGQIAEFIITAKNTGEVPLRNVRISDNYDLSLAPREASPDYSIAGGALNWTVAQIAPGETVQKQVNCECLRAVRSACNSVTVTADGGVLMAAEACVEVTSDAVAPPPDIATEPGKLSVTAADLADPVRVEGDLNYLVMVTNRSDALDKQILLVIHLPAGTTLKEIVGPPTVRATQMQDTLRFDSIVELRPHESLSFEVRTRADRAGTVRLQVEASSQRLTQPTTAEESTLILEKQ